jgi:serine O-acetyltransferase
VDKFRGIFVADLHRYSNKPFPRGVPGALLRHPGYAACILLRMQQVAGILRAPSLARILRFIALSLFGIDSIPGNAIGPGLLLPHPNGVVIGKGAVIGRNATLLQQVTIGEKHLNSLSDGRYPVLGDNVTVGAGAKVLGGVRLLDRTTIGANSVVLIDTPEDSLVVGAPARVIQVRYRSESAGPPQAPQATLNDSNAEQP